MIQQEQGGDNIKDETSIQALIENAQKQISNEKKLSPEIKHYLLHQPVV